MNQTRQSEESLQPQSECVTALRALVAVLEVDNKPLLAHTARRSANRMVRLEETIRRQKRQLQRYQNAANALKQLGGLL